MAEIGDKVGTKVVFENDRVRVWDLVLEPGEETGMHRHDMSYIWYAIQGGQLYAEDEHGNDLGIIDVPTGSVFNIRHNGGDLEVLSEAGRGIKIPPTHKAKNISAEPYREILIEFKD
ncbi:MAG: hypothetical protein AB8C46_18210 [Burkholderiaceae bacterium]